MYKMVYCVLFLLCINVVIEAGTISVVNKTASPVDVVVRYPQWMRSKITQVYPNKTVNITDVNQFAQVQVLDDYEQPQSEAWVNPLDKASVKTNGTITISKDKDKMQVNIQ